MPALLRQKEATTYYDQLRYLVAEEVQRCFIIEIKPPPQITDLLHQLEQKRLDAVRSSSPRLSRN
jgi:hypothetical protein